MPMEQLLASLGFVVNERTRRATCLIHSGSNSSAFAWRDDGRWHCHSCSAGGDKISLVRAVKKCGFRDAVEILAALAGVEFQANRADIGEIKRLQAEREALREESSAALAMEISSWQAARDAVLRLEEIRRNARRRLQEISSGSSERWNGEVHSAWATLADVSRAMPRAAVAYAIASFGALQDRLLFALDPGAAESLIDETLENGYVTNERGQRFEVML